jgi:hypothetical protein
MPAALTSFLTAVFAILALSFAVPCLEWIVKRWRRGPEVEQYPFAGVETAESFRGSKAA